MLRRVKDTEVSNGSSQRSTEEENDEGGILTCARNMSLKPLCHIRVANLPPGFVRKNVSQIRSDDYGIFVQVSGTTIRTGKIKMLELEKEYRCSYQRCGHTFRVMADLEQGGIVEMPKRCPSGEFMAAGQKRCKSTRFDEVEGSCVCSDYQEIRIQEKPQSLGVGSIPRQICVILQHDLVDTCKAGDEAVISGVVLRRWSPVYNQERCSVELVLLANSVQVRNANAGGKLGGTNEEDEEIRATFERYWSENRDRPLCARNQIIRSFCPQLYSMFVVKLAVTLVLLGGVGRSQRGQQSQSSASRRSHSRSGSRSRRARTGIIDSYAESDENDTYERSDESRKRRRRSGVRRNASASSSSQQNEEDDERNMRRGEAHLLLVGDPGTGKSQLLRYAAKLSPRAVMTTGTGTTSAGLTCSAVKDGGEWMLEGGALVLADRGLCCIDEFGNIRVNDRATIHEAMEQQTLSVAKAGLVCKLNTRCAIMAVTNPKGKYDTSQDVSVNTAIASPLLSRFDIVLVLLDTVDDSWDRKVSSFILDGAMVSRSKKTDISAPSSSQSSSDSLSQTCSPNATDLWSMKKLRSYFQWARHRFMPKLTEDAQTILKAYYQKQRRTDAYDRDAARTTIRLLESLVRLTQAHARLMAHDEADLTDAVVAVMMVESSTNTLNVLAHKSALHEDFPEDADEAHREQNLKVLHSLGLLRLLDASSDRGFSSDIVTGDTTSGVSVRPSQWHVPSPNRAAADTTDDAPRAPSLFGTTRRIASASSSQPRSAKKRRRPSRGGRANRGISRN